MVPENHLIEELQEEVLAELSSEEQSSFEESHKVLRKPMVALYEAVAQWGELGENLRKEHVQQPFTVIRDSVVEVLSFAGSKLETGYEDFLKSCEGTDLGLDDVPEWANWQDDFLRLSQDIEEALANLQNHLFTAESLPELESRLEELPSLQSQLDLALSNLEVHLGKMELEQDEDFETLPQQEEILEMLTQSIENYGYFMDYGDPGFLLDCKASVERLLVSLEEAVADAGIVEYTEDEDFEVFEEPFLES